MAKIEINSEYCKSCELCLDACKKDVLGASEKINTMGYHFMIPIKQDNCVGCTLCAVICPEGAIEVYR